MFLLMYKFLVKVQCCIKSFSISGAAKPATLAAAAAKAEPIVLKDPPPEYEFIADPPSISAYDLDVVKLTAQFVARNGRQFLTNLMVRRTRCIPTMTGSFDFDVLSEYHV